MTQELLNKNYGKLLPIVGEDFKEVPLYFSLADDSEYFALFADKTQADLQKAIDKTVASMGKTWSISGYLEKRATVLNKYPQMVSEERFFHLGLDINLPVGTNLYAPFDCAVELSGYEKDEGDYGGFILLRCKNNDTEFFMLFGHLDSNKLSAKGTPIKKGEIFAQIGDTSQNGNWYYHTHLQILTPLAYDKGWISKGYCHESDLSVISEFCPDPFLFLLATIPAACLCRQCVFAF